MKRFSGCRILMIANRFFGIEDNIRKSLEAEGATVDYFDERPGNGFLVKALIRVNSRLIKGYVNRYHERLIESVKGRRYDYIFFIKGESFSYRNLESLLKSHSEAVSIVYHWDSIVDNANALNLLELFDRKFSFDPDDCRRYDMSFLPLFYYDEYARLNKKRGEEREERREKSMERKDSGEYKYDLLFVGTAHN
ncbi:MAG: hypothetical protein K2H18_06100, partial [Muribaculaceae bacterium]|nr:hypothetical protein [Muribaculaceae bacterium]